MSHPKYTAGRFETDVVTGPAIEVDCSKWVDTTDGTWTFGRFETDVVTGPATVTDCSSWIPKPARLILTLTLHAGADAAEVTKALEPILMLANAYEMKAGGQGLVWDRAASKAEAGTLTLVLEANDPLGAAERFAELANLLAPVLSGAKNVQCATVTCEPNLASSVPT
jgi:hypothetical protein